jgi:hypothetical protein
VAGVAAIGLADGGFAWIVDAIGVPVLASGIRPDDLTPQPPRLHDALEEILSGANATPAGSVRRAAVRECWLPGHAATFTEQPSTATDSSCLKFRKAIEQSFVQSFIAQPNLKLPNYAFPDLLPGGLMRVRYHCR